MQGCSNHILVIGILPKNISGRWRTMHNAWQGNTEIQYVKNLNNIKKGFY